MTNIRTKSHPPPSLAGFLERFLAKHGIDPSENKEEIKKRNNRVDGDEGGKEEAHWCTYRRWASPVDLWLGGGRDRVEL